MRTPSRFVRALGAALALCVLPFAPAATAHDARPAHLRIEEVAPGRYDLLWRIPVFSGRPLPVGLALPQAMRNVTEPVARSLSDSLVERRLVEIDTAARAGARIEFPGLEATITDVLVRTTRLDGAQSTTLVRPARPWFELEGETNRAGVASAYVAYGVEHILLGFDHLLFVLALVLIVPGRRALLLAVTAFTAAHSITLALATLGVVRVPGPPVEAAIALSVLLLAYEIAAGGRSRSSAAARWPWLVAFAFGLLHGFGFAGALTEIGLPPGDVPLALFAFNVGVEAGQLVFIGALFGALAIARRTGMPVRFERRALRVACYGIGILAAFWFFERVSGFGV